jgi:hypothetical protein
LNGLVSRALAASLVFLYHSVPDYVAGDWFVDKENLPERWYFKRSRFLAAIDAHFDYKHERQKKLSELVSARSSRVTF